MTSQQKKKVAELVTQLVVVVGLCVFVRGVWLAWRPGGWMAAGLLIAAPALFLAYGSFRESK